MSATDELRRLLTECGIEWRYADDSTTYWYGTLDGTEWGEWTAIEHGGLLHVTFDSGDFVTPEQAVAATLGDGEYESKMDALLCQLTNGKWSMTRKYSLEFMESLVHEEFEEAFAAESVTETCRFRTVIDKDPSRRHRGNICECSGCGYRCAYGFIVDERFKFCPNCGRRIEVDE